MLEEAVFLSLISEGGMGVRHDTVTSASLCFHDFIDTWSYKKHNFNSRRPLISNTLAGYN